MKEKIIGRTAEFQRLDECMEQDTAQLIIVYGRRRVGKTFLINEYFDNDFTFKITGAYNQPAKYQLQNFVMELNRSFRTEYSVPKDWVSAFDMLRTCLEEQATERKKVVFFDEMPWLDTRGSGFLSAFEWFWNNWACARSDIVFIVCGSASSWMVEKLADNKGGLFNRQTCRLYLKPFNLNEVEDFLQKKGIYWSHYEIAECYMIMGGIPYYLSLLSNRYSYSQNIDNLFFRDKGELWDEFDHLYKTLFSNSASYIKLVELLSKKTGGLTLKEIAEKSQLFANGTLSDMIKNLVDSGFARVTNFYGKKKKDALYQLSDYYTAFYFRYIKDNYGKDEHFWSNAVDNPARRSWAGLSFEQLCKDHISEIKRKIGISGVLSEESVWYTKGNKELGISGSQIDLLIERRDNVINICEMKFSLNEFLVDKDYDMALRNKIDTFRRMTNSRKSLQLTMVTSYGAKPNKYSGLVQSQVTLDDLF